MSALSAPDSLGIHISSYSRQVLVFRVLVLKSVVRFYDRNDPGNVNMNVM